MDTTKKKILKAATQLFIEKGFAGTSISSIAAAAGVNQSLIYHHVGNKEQLWKEVKKDMLDSLTDLPFSPSDSFPLFLSYVIIQRLTAYESEPRLLRLIQWQMLEGTEDLRGESIVSPLGWINAIRGFQERGEISSHYDANLIAVYLHSLINGLIFDPLNVFKNDPSQKKIYIEMVKKGILGLLQVS